MDRKGDSGKTAMSRYLEFTKDAIQWKPIGEDKDCSHRLLQETDEVPPSLIVCDLEGNEGRKVCWAALERAKNGECTSCKYEGGRYVGKRPHIIVFSNENQMGAPFTSNRLRITEIIDKQLGDSTIE